MAGVRLLVVHIGQQADVCAPAATARWGRYRTWPRRIEYQVYRLL